MSVHVLGFVEDEAPSQAALHSRGGPPVPSRGSGCPAHPDSCRPALLIICQPGKMQTAILLESYVGTAGLHCAAFPTQVLDCPRLMETVMAEFLPTSWESPSSLSPVSVYGHPLANAMKLLRVLATAGRHACARLVNMQSCDVFFSGSHGKLLVTF